MFPLPAVPPACLLDPSLGSHEYVTANGIKFHCVSAGDTSKPLMLLLHGFPEVSRHRDSFSNSPPSKAVFLPLLPDLCTSTIDLFSHCVQFWFSWRYQLREFSSDYHVVAVDMRSVYLMVYIIILSDKDIKESGKEFLLS